MKTIAPYGTWQSDITASFVASQSLRTGSPLFWGDDLLWLEARPAEQGRQVVVMKTADGNARDLLPSPWSARSKVHEYGGGAYTAAGNTLYFVNAQDQQIYSMDIETSMPVALTNAKDCRFADLSLNKDQSKLVAVCEKHQGTEQNDAKHQEPENFIVSIDLSTSDITLDETQLKRVAEGHDFYSNPRFSPCGKWLCYISWNHPNMPWDNTHLWLQDAAYTAPAQLIAGHANESVVQPVWSPKGDLFWVSDKSNWWNIYQLEQSQLHQPKDSKCIYQREAEFATPQWIFGMSSYAFLNSDSILASFSENGVWKITEIQKNGLDWQAIPIATELNYFSEFAASNNQAIFSAASAKAPAELYLYKNGSISKVASHCTVKAEEEDISIGEMIHFPTSNNATAYGVFYPPKNANYEALNSEKPPVIVFGHGGPTGSCDAFFRYKIQFWTQRGFAVLDVNYRGSTGYGRRFRHSLQKQWGVYDVEDLSAAAEHVTQLGWVHPHKRIIRGSSAGGFSVMAALTDTKTFDAGCTLYGIGDLETLATDTHKFESRYLDGLIGPYPEQKQLYVERSPIHKIAQISCPVMVFQGAEDKVVPPEQAEMIVSAVKDQGLPVGYTLYENEGHGFRRAKNIEHQAETELYFYQRVLGLKEFDPIEPTQIKISNLEVTTAATKEPM